MIHPLEPPGRGAEYVPRTDGAVVWGNESRDAGRFGAYNGSLYGTALVGTNEIDRGQYYLPFNGAEGPSIQITRTRTLYMRDIQHTGRPDHGMTSILCAAHSLGGHLRPVTCAAV